MISNFALVIFIISIVTTLVFILRMSHLSHIKLIHKLYFMVGAVMIIWFIAIILLKFTDPTDIAMLRRWEALSYFGAAFAPVFSVYVALAFTTGVDKFPKQYLYLIIVPIITNIMVWTNPLHNLFYRHFSLSIEDIEFGTFFYVHAVYVVICLVVSTIIIINFAINSRNTLYFKQAILFSVGNIIPIVVNFMAISGLFNLSIAATPLAFAGTIICHGLAIYWLHFLDIKPIAMNQVLNQITDCYLITGADGLIIGYNEPFMDVIGRQHGIKENSRLKDCLKDEDVEYKTVIYNLLTSMESCRVTNSSISFEQAINQQENETWRKLYYIVEINPLIIDEIISGFIAIFKDVSKLRESMQRLQDSQVRLMEQERLASLGQMVGGLAHNLKTPIMSIAGSSAAMNNLVEEASISIGDADVTAEDYQEIYDEMRGWLQKIRDACSYMSDIITAVKGQAGNMDSSEYVDFSLEDTLKRVSLLLRHELQGGRCKLVKEILIPGVTARDILIHGDINNLVQVVNNLVSNAVFAQIPDRKHEILFSVTMDGENLLIAVKDWGTGIKPEIKNKLFRQMITSKGNKGTGLGVYISNAVIRGKFGGDILMEDNPEGGSIFTIRIPLENVKIKQTHNFGDSEMHDEF